MNQSRFSDYAKRLLLTVVEGVSLFLLWHTAEIFLFAFAGLLLAVFFRTLSKPLSEHTPIADRWAVLIIVLLLLVLLGLAGWFFSPRLITQAEQVVERVPQALGQLQGQIEQYPWGQRLLDELPTEGGTSFRGVLPQVFSTFSTTVNAIFHALFIFFVGVFLAVSPRFYQRGLVRLVPKPKRQRAHEVIRAVITTLRRWLLGRLISMAAVGVFVSLGLWLLGMPLVLILGLLAALLDFIPFIGPFISAAPAVLLALVESPIQALYVALVYVAAQQLEGNLITPLVQKETASLPPVLTIIAVLAVGTLFGLPGLLVATPLLAVGLVLVKMLYVEDVLGDEVKVAGSE